LKKEAGFRVRHYFLTFWGAIPPAPANPILYDALGRRRNIPREDGSKWAYGYNTRGEITSGGKQQK